MAIQATVTTVHGEERSLYLRVNNSEISNHGMTSQALVRGFLSKEAFEVNGKMVNFLNNLMKKFQSISGFLVIL